MNRSFTLYLNAGCIPHAFVLSTTLPISFFICFSLVRRGCVDCSLAHGRRGGGAVGSRKSCGGDRGKVEIVQVKI